MPQNRLYAPIWEPYLSRRTPRGTAVGSRAEQRARALLPLLATTARPACAALLANHDTLRYHLCVGSASHDGVWRESVVAAQGGGATPAASALRKTKSDSTGRLGFRSRLSNMRDRFNWTRARNKRYPRRQARCARRHGPTLIGARAAVLGGYRGLKSDIKGDAAAPHAGLGFRWIRLKSHLPQWWPRGPSQLLLQQNYSTRRLRDGRGRGWGLGKDRGQLTWAAVQLYVDGDPCECDTSASAAAEGMSHVSELLFTCFRGNFTRAGGNDGGCASDDDEYSDNRSRSTQARGVHRVSNSPHDTQEMAVLHVQPALGAAADWTTRGWSPSCCMCQHRFVLHHAALCAEASGADVLSRNSDTMRRARDASHDSGASNKSTSMRPAQHELQLLRAMQERARTAEDALMAAYSAASEMDAHNGRRSTNLSSEGDDSRAISSYSTTNSRWERTETKLGRELTYGEIEPDGMLNAFEQLSTKYALNQNSTLYDLGSGEGRAILFAAMVFPVKRAVGIEIVRDRHLRAVKAYGRLQKITWHRFAATHVLLRHGDALAPDSFSDATHVYAANLLFTPAMNVRLAMAIASAPALQCAIVLKELPLAALPQGWKLGGRATATMSWSDDAPIFFYYLASAK